MSPFSDVLRRFGRRPGAPQTGPAGPFRAALFLGGVLAVLVAATPAWCGEADEPGEPDEPSAEASRTTTPGLERDVLGFADSLFDETEFYRAIGEYERYLFLCESCARRDYAQRRMADAYRAGGEVQRAIDLYERVLAAAGDAEQRAHAAWARAQTFSDADRHADAAAAYSSFATAFPTDARAATGRWEAVWSRIRARELERAAEDAAALPDGDAKKPDATRLAEELQGSRDIKRRSPLLAGLLSGILPGAGQVYVGRWRDALSAFLMNGLWTTAAIVAWQQGWIAAAIVVGTGELFWYAGNVYGAVTSAHRFNRLQERYYFEDLEDRYLGTPAQASRTLVVPVLAFRF